MKSILYRYKALGDLALSSYFLSPILPWLRLRYQRSLWVLAPQNSQQDLKRGFTPLGPILQGFKTCEIFQKKDDYKQSEQPFFLRKNIQDHVIVHTQRLNGIPKKHSIIVVDDVMTSGETMKWMLHVLRQHGYFRLQGLVISRPIKP
jgi:predicted amidophosphoribosyltransferase